MSEEPTPPILLTQPTKHSEEVRAVIARGAPEPVARDLVASELRRARLTRHLQDSREDLQVAQTDAITDHLTGAYTRKWMEEQLKIQVAEAKRAGTPFTVLFVDLDKIKSINDSEGHAAGDLVIIDAVQKMRKVVPRASDSIARIGGDEFTILMPDTPEFFIDENGVKQGGAMEKAQQIADLFTSPTCSIGVAQLTDDITPIELLNRADAAMYVAKLIGKNPDQPGFAKSNVAFWKEGQVQNPERA